MLAPTTVVAPTAPSSSPHVPVLAEAVRRLAAVQAGEVWVDCTLGFGGHTAELLAAGAQVYGLDKDADARAATAARLDSDRLTVLAGDFRDVQAHLARVGVTHVDGVLADLGVSSWQLDQPERGFSFQSAGPVDMRMDASAPLSAMELLQTRSVSELAEILRRDGEEPFAGPIARAMKAWVEGPGPHTTTRLAATIRSALPARVAHARNHHPATQAFQALRIAVNDELGALDALLASLPTVLRPGGRALIISFHSLEDRRVKQTFAQWTRPPEPPRRGLPAPNEGPTPFVALTRKAVEADEAEVARNPRSRSAKLRAVQRRAEGDR